MNLDINKLQETLSSMCSEVKIRSKNVKLFSIETPFYFDDGDSYQIYIKEMPGGIIRLTDMGHTIMRLSYENDIDKFRKVTSSRIFKQIKSETLINEENGEFYIDTSIENLGINIFRLVQALTKINDKNFW